MNKLCILFLFLTISISSQECKTETLKSTVQNEYKSLPVEGAQLDYIPISPAYPEKENRLILKGWGVELRVLGWVFWGYINQSGTVFGTN
jgi:hypothetical protein